MWLPSLILSLVFLHHCKGEYAAFVPTEFHPGWPLNVHVSVTGGRPGETVVVMGKLQISDESMEPLASQAVVLNNNEMGVLELLVPKTVPLGEYKVRLEGTGGLAFVNSTEISLDHLTRITFIQTDKAIYKPGQKVQFRVMSTDKDLSPEALIYTIEITNSEDNKLAVFNSEKAAFVFKGTYDLGKFPKLGTWTITVKKDSEKLETRTFKVDEYVPPKAEVTAKTSPGYVIGGREKVEITLEVTAKYTYGKGVKGRLDVTIDEPAIKDGAVMSDPSGMKSMTLTLNLAKKTSGVITIKVQVTDQAGLTYETTTSVRVESKPVKISFDESSEKVYRPGMGLRIVAKITDPDGRPLDASTLALYRQVNISLTDYSDSTQNLYKVVTLGEGESKVVWNINEISSTNNRLNLKVQAGTGKESITAYDGVEKFKTVGNKALRIETMAGTLNVGDQFTFTVQPSDTTDFSAMYYMVVSRGNIQPTQETGSLNPAGETKTLTVSTDMCPQGRLLVYGITSDEEPEIIADSFDLKILRCQEKYVSPRVQNSQQRTGTEATIQVQIGWTDASRDEKTGKHEVYMLAVDKSILLLEGHNDITPQEVDQKLERFNLPRIEDRNPVPWARRRRSIMPFPPTSGPSTGQLLKNAGIEVLSDTAVAETEPVIWLRKEVEAVAFNRPADAGMVDEEMAKPPSEAPVQTKRKDFPDTWIFDSLETDENGFASFTEKLPDTITSWEISGFAVPVQEGPEIAVTDIPFSLKAFNPFFVTLNLPYSIRRGERFEVPATVFNYLNADQNVKLTLSKSDNFDIESQNIYMFNVKANDAVSLTFVIKATTVGTITLKVTADADRNVDQLEKKLIVKPEGVQRARSETEVVILTENSLEFQKEFVLDFGGASQDDIIKQSRRAEVSITGDLMGSPVQNLDNLLRMPSGCGEQTMITTVPNIVAITYLESVGDLTTEFAEKAKKNIEDGYTREKTYRWKNGGFSAFGESDKNASTWLTAFVLKSFSLGRKYIKDQKDFAETMEAAANFLFATQEEEGSFKEHGKVIHTEMTGGASRGNRLTAYVTLCLLEAKRKDVKINEERLRKALDYIRKNVYNQVLGNVADDMYLTSLVAYVLSMDHPADSKALLQKLSASDAAPWKMKQEEKPENSPTPYRSHTSKPSDVEITAYCLLAYNILDMKGEGRDLVLWAGRNQGPQGGYRSTQDTIMMLQALSEFAASFRDADPEAIVSVRSLDPESEESSHRITRGNAMLLRYIPLPDETNRVMIRVTGKKNSMAVVKVLWYFNVPANMGEEPGPGEENKPQIYLDTTTKKISETLHEIKSCFRPSEDSASELGMMLMNIDLPSGMQIADIVNARKTNPDIARMEVNENQLEVYIDEFVPNCLTVEAEEIVRVNDRKPGVTTLFAYYSPAVKQEAYIHIADSPALCQDESCKTCEGDCPSSIATNPASLGRLLLAACICLLLSLVLAV